MRKRMAWLILALWAISATGVAKPMVKLPPLPLSVPELLLDWKPSKGDIIDGVPYEGDATVIDHNQAWSKSKRLPELHHLVGVPLLNNMHPPSETMPLGEKKELVCKTCHGIKNIEDLPFDKVDKKANDFLKAGPYDTLTDFCYRCHEKKAHERPNIHVMLDKQGEIIEKNCTYCHTEVLKRDRTYKPDELKLRVPRETLCFGCHLKTPHLNAVEHQVKPSKEKLKQLEASVKKLGIILPLSNDGKMMCVTCHSSHPNGVLDKKLAAAKQVENNDLKEGVSYSKHPWAEVYAADKQSRLDTFNRESGEQLQVQYARINAEVLLRLPAKDGSLCLACHTFTDREY